MRNSRKNATILCVATKCGDGVIIVLNQEMAFWQCFLFNLDEFSQPKRILKSESFSHALQYLKALRKCLAAEFRGETSALNDLKDYLYWRHRESRLLQNMAYFRRCYLPHFAPFLFDHTLAVIRTIPGKLRIQKTLFLEMARTEFPVCSWIPPHRNYTRPLRTALR